MKEQIWLPDVKYLGLSLNTLLLLVFGIDMHRCTITRVIGINKEIELCLPNKEYISGHIWGKRNMVVKFIVHIPITAELKAYLLLDF